MEGLLYQFNGNTNRKRITLTVIGVIAIIGATACFFLFQSSNSLIVQEFELEHDEFKSFTEQYGKSYKDSDEYAHRFSVFRTNSAYIRVKNSQESTWKLGINQFTDLTHEEFKSTYLTLKVDYQPTEKRESINQLYSSQVD